MAVFILAGSFVCIAFSPAVIAITGQIDPREVVADEFAGQALTYLAVLFFTIDKFTSLQILVFTGLGYLFFRLFDIVKPWPIDKLQKFSAGWGILADDLLAGLYAAVVLFIFQRLWAAYYVSLDI